MGINVCVNSHIVETIQNKLSATANFDLLINVNEELRQLLGHVYRELFWEPCGVDCSGVSDVGWVEFLDPSAPVLGFRVLFVASPTFGQLKVLPPVRR